MARKPRIHLEGGQYYVGLRARDGRSLFRDDEDRRALVRLIGEAARRYRARIYAYSLLDRRLELVATVSESPLYKLVQTIVYRYKRHLKQRGGSPRELFQGRYQSCLLQPQGVLGDVIAFVHTAPVRAGAAERPGDYAWSGHLALTGERGPGIVDVAAALKAFDADPATARQRYQWLTSDPEIIQDTAELGHQLARARVLGDEVFRRRVERQVREQAGRRPSLNRVVGRVAREYGLSEADLAAPRRLRKPAQARAVIGYLAIETGAATLTEVAERFGRDIATLSIAVNRLTERQAAGFHIARRLREELAENRRTG